MYRIRQRYLYTVYSRHELYSYTGWSTEDRDEECTAWEEYVNVQQELTMFIVQVEVQKIEMKSVQQEKNLYMYNRN